LFAGSAFQPHPLDAGVPLSRRFAGQSLLLLMTARERAATLQVSFSRSGEVTMGEARQVGHRVKGDLVSALKTEARACGARWVLVSIGSGWQVQYARRSLRAGGDQDSVAAMLRLREDPALFVPKPSGDCLYAAVDHPHYDRSLVFSVKRREVDALLDDVREAGLELAGVRVGMASLVEAWFHQVGAEAVRGDTLLCDGLGVLQLGFEDGDFFPAADCAGESNWAPRQCANRPGDVAQDIARLWRDNASRACRYVGVPELAPRDAEALSGASPEIVALDACPAVLSGVVRHEFHPELCARRPALSSRVRLACMASLATGLLAWLGVGGLWAATWSVEGEIEQEQVASRMASSMAEDAVARKVRCEELRKEAQGHLDWLRTHPGAQRLLQRLLLACPQDIALERMSAQLDEGGRQLSLEFQLQGTPEAQEHALREIETVLLALGYRIGERNTPAAAHRGSLHRWRLIAPPAFEEGRLS